MVNIDNCRTGFCEMFRWCRDSMIESYFEGHIGTACADYAEEPNWAAVFSGDFVYLSGKPVGIEELAERINSMSAEIVLIPQNSEWEGALNACGLNVATAVRYKTELPAGGLDIKLLESKAGQIARFKRGSLRLAGEAEYEELKRCDWENAFVSNFRDYEDFKENGFAFCVYIGKDLAAAASTFGYYSGGYELQLATKPVYRSQGLAEICAARFLLECIERGKTPHWDAANKTSLHIAQKLGFEFAGEYISYVKA